MNRGNGGTGAYSAAKSKRSTGIGGNPANDIRSEPSPNARLRHLISRLDSRVTPASQRNRWRVDEGAFPAWLTDNAIYGLARRFPGSSAKQVITAGQKRFLALGLAIFCAALIFNPILAFHVITACATLFFGMVVALRVVACINLLADVPMRFMRRPAASTPDHNLPIYTLLIPLFREANVLEGLVRALKALDYPASKLDIKLICESIDAETIQRARDLNLPRQFELVIVPNSLPRTKPKALNYAFQMARGEYVVVYDAEDRPHPRQLRDALDAFAAGPPNLACLQARLIIYNGAENWLTKQFAIEYGTLFCGLLPTFQALGLPIPLGGTSNHFRSAALKWLGGWDAFNVTEDADLGMRLYQHGYICRMLNSETGEEAPCSLKPWILQRTRWLKGWMQTWLVHMRKPLRQWHRLGTGRFLGLQIIVAGMIFSALAHPFFWILLALEFSNTTPFQFPKTVMGVHVWLIAMFNVAIGFLASMALSLIALRQTGLRFIAQIPFLPVYWLMISFAAYRALFQLVIDPFHWEKTEHGVSKLIRAEQMKRPH